MRAVGILGQPPGVFISSAPIALACQSLKRGNLAVVELVPQPILIWKKIVPRTLSGYADRIYFSDLLRSEPSPSCGGSLGISGEGRPFVL